MVSRREKWVLIWSTFGLFACFASFSSPEQALFRTFAIGAFVVVFRTKWARRHDRRFWALLVALAVLHVAVLLLGRLPAPRFGMEAMPFFAADTFAMLGLVNWVERRFWAVGDGGPGPSASERSGGPLGQGATAPEPSGGGMAGGKAVRGA